MITEILKPNQIITIFDFGAEIFEQKVQFLYYSEYSGNIVYEYNDEEFELVQGYYEK